MAEAFNAAAAAALLLKHWTSGAKLALLPQDIRPHSRRQGYDVQAHIGDDAGLYGWKIAATSIAGQQHINVSGPIAGRIFAHSVVPYGATCSLKNNSMRLAEPEFAFRMARDLPPRSAPYTTQQALDAVDTLHPAIELPDTRYLDVTKVGEAQIIADNACGHNFVLGPATTANWREIDLAEIRPIAQVGGRYMREGLGANVLGDPRVALAWLVNELSSLGLTLRAGAVVTTGTCCAPLDIAPGETVTVDYGPLGTISVAFCD